jgi:DnaJ-class molecular chaperone
VFIICPECRGRGTITVYKIEGEEERPCPRCHGAGEVYDPNSSLGDGSDKSIGF